MKDNVGRDTANSASKGRQTAGRPAGRNYTGETAGGGTTLAVGDEVPPMASVGGKQTAIPRRRSRLVIGLARDVKKWLPAGLIIIGIIGNWEWLVATNDIPAWKLPSPSGIGMELWVSRGLLLGHTWVTVEEVLIGFAVALVSGVTLACLIHHSRTLERVIYPGVVASQTIPIIVIAPLLLIWLGYGIQHKVFVVALISFFPIVVNTVDGFKSTDPDMVNLLKTLGADRWQIFRKVYVPSSLPFLFSGIKIAITVSVIGAVIGEWVGSSEGLGYLAIRSKSQFLSERVYATVVLLSLMGIGLFLIAGALERVMLPWYHNERRRT